MEQLTNEPIISHFLQSIPEADKKNTLKQLLLLGINTVSAQVHCGEAACCCNGQQGQQGQARQGVGCCQWKCQCMYVPNMARVFQTASFSNNISSTPNYMAQQIKKMKQRILQLQSQLHPESIAHSGNLKQNLPPASGNEKHQFLSHADSNVNNMTGGGLKPWRHHLDDSEVRRALVNPYAKGSPNKNMKKINEKQMKQKTEEMSRKHQLQKQKDQQQMKRIKAKNQSATFAFSEQQNQNQQNYKQKTKLKNSSSQKGNLNIQSSFGNTNMNTITSNGKTKNKNNKTANFNNNSNSNSNGNQNQNPNSNARSKIKSLIERDKERSKRDGFRRKGYSHYEHRDNNSKGFAGNYCQFEYSDEEEFIQQQSEYARSQQKNYQQHCPVHPEQSGKKKNRRSQQKDSQSFSQQSLSAPNNKIQFHQQINKNKMKRSRKDGQRKQFKNAYKQTKKRMKESAEKERIYEQQQQQEQQNHQSDHKQQQQGHEDFGDNGQVQHDYQESQKSDARSESSSFSKFSMSSRREAGKISNSRSIKR